MNPFSSLFGVTKQHFKVSHRILVFMIEKMAQDIIFYATSSTRSQWNFLCSCKIPLEFCVKSFIWCNQVICLNDIYSTNKKNFHKVSRIIPLLFYMNQSWIYNKWHQNPHSSPKIMTDVVPSPTSSSWVLATSIKDLAAGCWTLIFKTEQDSCYSVSAYIKQVSFNQTNNSVSMYKQWFNWFIS